MTRVIIKDVASGALSQIDVTLPYDLSETFLPGTYRAIRPSVESGDIVVADPLPASALTSEDWDAREAQPDADARKSFIQVFIAPPSGMAWYASRGPVADIPAASLIKLTFNGTTGFYEATSAGQNTVGVETFHRIAVGTDVPSGDPPDLEWVVDVGDAKSFFPSTVPQAPVITWAEAGTGAVDIIFGEQTVVGRAPTVKSYSLDGGANWINATIVNPNVQIPNIELTGLTAEVPTNVLVRLANANGDGPAATIVVTAEAVVTDVAPTFSAAHSLDGRVVSIIASDVTGTPAPALSMSVFTVAGVAATPLLVSPNVWRYTLASNEADVTIAYQVSATNAAGTATVDGSLVVVADLEPPVVAPDAAAVSALPVYDATPDTSVVGGMTLSITSVPANATSLRAVISGSGYSDEDILITNSPTVGTLNFVLPEFYIGRMVRIRLYGANATFGAGPIPSRNGAPRRTWVPCAPILSCVVGPTNLRSGIHAMLGLRTRGWPEPVIEAFTATMDGNPITLAGPGSFKTFLVPPGSAGKVITLTVSATNKFGTTSTSATYTVGPDIVWNAPKSVTPATFAAEFAAAVGNDVLVLADGDYGAFNWNKALSAPIKITSLNPKGAVFDRIGVSTANRRNIWLEDITTGTLAFSSTTKQIMVLNCQVNGAVFFTGCTDSIFADNTVSATGLDSAYKVEDSLYHHCHGNNFDDAIYDATRIYGANKYVAFDYNVVERNTPYPDANYVALHPDLIQMGGLTNRGDNCSRTSRIWRNFFSDNQLVQVGGRGSQGIIIGAPNHDEGFTDFSISENVVRSGITQRFLAVNMSLGSTIYNNSFNGQITIAGDFGSVFRDNLCTGINLDSVLVDWRVFNYAQGGWSFTGPLTELTGFIPTPESGVPNDVGATPWLLTLLTGPPAEDSVLTDIDPSGWFGTLRAPLAGATNFDPVAAPVTVEVDRLGFGTSLTPVTKRRNLRLLTRKREPYSGGSRFGAPVWTPDEAVLEEFLYTYDTPVGFDGTVTHASFKILSRPIELKRQAVTTEIEVMTLAYHAHAETEPLAGCQYTWTDGTITRTLNVLTTSLYDVPSTIIEPGFKQPFGCYRAMLDVTGMADGLITVNRKLFPIFGTEADVIDTATSGEAILLNSPRYFHKVPAGSKRYVAIHTTAGTSGGIVATRSGYASDEAAALAAIAAPYQTWTQAMVALNSAPYYQGNAEVIICDDGLTSFQLTTGRSQPCAHLIVTSAHNYDAINYTRVGTRLQTGGAPNMPSNGLVTGEGWMIVLRKIDVLRNNAYSSSASSGGYIEFDDCYVDFAAASTVNGSNIRSAFRGCRIANLAASSVSNAYLFLGNHGTSWGGLEWELPGTVVAGNYCHRSGRVLSGSNQLIVANKMLQCGNSAQPVLSQQTDAAYINNLIETASGGWDVMKISADDNTANAVNVIVRHNTFVSWASSRMNSLYDDTSGTPRFHRGFWLQGNIAMSSFASKIDIFAAGVGESTRFGAPMGFALDHGVQAHGNMQLFASNFRCTAYGLNGIHSLGLDTGDVERFWGDNLNPRFPNIGVAHVDALGASIAQSVGNYKIVDPLSPAKNRVRMLNGPLVKWDIEGNLRTGNIHDAGCYIIA
jgi:hypothetical protein